MKSVGDGTSCNFLGPPENSLRSIENGSRSIFSIMNFLFSSPQKFSTWHISFSSPQNWVHIWVNISITIDLQYLVKINLVWILKCAHLKFSYLYFYLNVEGNQNKIHQVIDFWEDAPLTIQMDWARDSIFGKFCHPKVLHFFYSCLACLGRFGQHE